MGSCKNSVEDRKIEENRMNLKFGTGGLRAVMGEGPDCLNIENVREATLGVAGYIKKRCQQPKIAICYDSRNQSEEFARETAKVFASKECVVYISETLMPTPFLSFVIRKQQCDLGVCITASHNPKEYNGYKVYGEDGCQITGKVAKAIQQEIFRENKWIPEKGASFEEYRSLGKIRYISNKMQDDFCEEILSYGLERKVDSVLNIIYSPLNGAGKLCVTKVLEEKGFTGIHIVKEQSEPDGDFPTCPYPNPEDDKAMELGIKLCEEMAADIFLATDPDSDRVGVVAKKGKNYQRLNGNQVGVLLLDYILRTRKEKGILQTKPVIIKTIVTTEMVRRIAEDYNAEVIDTLTGFKYIGEKIGELEQRGELDRFVLGVEESCGYLIGPYVRDKDAVGASMLICEMADKYKKQGKSLWDRLEELYQKYGYYESVTQTRNFDERDAEYYMQSLRKRIEETKYLEEFGGRINHYKDYMKTEGNLPKANVVKIWFQNGSSLIVRPSGTEPKIKFYKEHISGK